MPVENVRVSKSGKIQLTKLKRHTGIKNWNVLCRWALCTSLAEDTDPPEIDIQLDSNVEMTWKTFAGSSGDLLWALIQQRCANRGIDRDEETLAKYFRLHLHRGISYLSGDRKLRSIEALVNRGLA